MEVISTLGALMGLAFVSGIRLYSTVVAVGLGLRFGFLHVPESLAHLEILATTPVLLIAGAFYTIEFFADKIPWVDSLWDVAHTFIRPLGAAVIAAGALGEVDPEWRVAAFLVGGTVALSSHSAKAGTRLAANHSPEPMSNIGLSLGEDALVAGGVWMALTHPVWTLAVVVSGVLVILWLVPKLFQLFRQNFGRLVALFRSSKPGAEGFERVRD